MEMQKVVLLACAILAIRTCRACDDRNADQLAVAQESDAYFANVYGLVPDKWNAVYYPQISVECLNITKDEHHLAAGNPEHIPSNKVEGRFALGGLGANLINTGLFNNRFTPANTWRPFAGFANRIPVTYNPNFDNPLDTFDACTSPSGDAGICVPGTACSLFGGRPGGSCVLGKVCCINAITGCGGQVTLNNTYWQSPTAAVRASSSCGLTIRLNSKYIEQLKKPVCQIRLDFVFFTTAQPTLGTCTDTFQVGGSSSTVPIICGDNSGQHMYLDVPSSFTTPTDVQLMFNFGAGTATRSWNIKIAMLPCGASYLAPIDCLQYYSTSAGKVKSFNWQDVTNTEIRQLNNQNYNICFRTELLSGQRATEICLSACTVLNGDSFSITTRTSTAAVTTAAAVTAAQEDVDTAQTALNNVDTNDLAAVTLAQTALANAQAALTAAQQAAAEARADALAFSAVGTSAEVNGVTTATCLYDFLLIAGGRDATGIEADRYCGNALNPATAGSATNVQVCSPIKPFKMTYRTDGTEAAVVAATNILPAPADILNVGFCLDYQQK